VRITNCGSGGGTSDEGALALRYRLFHKQGIPPPDLIIHSYAQNDIYSFCENLQKRDLY
jgi:hypothetical protein